MENDPNRYDIFNLQTSEGKTPLFCALDSNAIKIDKKEKLIKIWFETGCVDLTLRNKSNLDLLDLAKKHKLD